MSEVLKRIAEKVRQAKSDIDSGNFDVRLHKKRAKIIKKEFIGISYFGFSGVYHDKKRVMTPNKQPRFEHYDNGEYGVLEKR